ncbi:histidine kinase [Microbacterium sp. X-17]|uniref:sensor histidine kinase n=1 Tax=Microbacterium sp. X-17 TaxID=3144404 RepID=UPI0031F55467
MSRRTEVVVGNPTVSDDDLLLPHPPGVLRRFWSQHPGLVDALVAAAAALISVAGVLAASRTPVPPSVAQMWFAIALALIASAALLFRRRRPILAFAVALLPALVLPPELAPIADVFLACAAFALAVYGSTRASWMAVGVATASIGVYALIAWLKDPLAELYATKSAIGMVVVLVIGALIGVNVGARRRYLEALIDRSRQLAVERDGQAQLAAAAERTRIAREMHDIVSHSLTVVVALSEGAAAASSAERARQASLEAAETARSALAEMRAMLGVLRDASDETSSLEPLEPVDPAFVVESAQRAGYPVTLATTGTTAAAPRAVRFALGRVVQEGVTNAMRHAPHATAIAVAIRTTEDAVSVSIRNDGARVQVSEGGFGLRGLRERVEHVGGTLTAGFGGAGSWQLSAILPLPTEIPEEGS